MVFFGAKIGDRHQITQLRAAKTLVFLPRNLEPVTDFHFIQEAAKSLLDTAALDVASLSFTIV